jgi:hypothetical protein
MEEIGSHYLIKEAQRSSESSTALSPPLRWIHRPISRSSGESMVANVSVILEQSIRPIYMKVIARTFPYYPTGNQSALLS